MTSSTTCSANRITTAVKPTDDSLANFDLFEMTLWEEYGISNWILLLISTFTLLYLYLNRKLQYWKSRGVTSPTFTDLLRNFWDMLTKPLQDNVLSNYRKFGRLHGTYMGVQPNLSVADPVLLKQILVKDFHVFHNRVKWSVGDPSFDNLLTIVQDDDWKRIRTIMSPTFSSSRMRKMAYLVRECSEKLAEHCEKTADKGEVDCKKFYSGFLVDIIASTAFGTKINALDNPNHPFVLNARKITTTDTSFFVIMIMFPKLIRILNRSFLGGVFRYFNEFVGVLRYFDEFALHVIREREKNNIRANDFLQLMLDAQRGKLEEPEEDVKEWKESPNIQILPDHKTMTLEEMLAQCTLFLLAGSENISATLAFLSHHLALETDYQQRLIEEIDRTWENNEEINFDVLSKMTYLDAVICEVLRMYPVTFQLFRIPSEDYVLCDTGITLQKDVPVIVPVYGMHRDPEFFPDPEKFDPERFMPENRHSIPQYAYLPFGEGPRNCIGMRFSMMVLKFCVVYVFRTVRMEATENTKKPFKFYKGQAIIQPKEVMVRMVKRRKTQH